ncbi:MAG: hypothetical protein LBR81_04185 [Prevotellaceae bacterium]|jgi:hypothetical protein|nr:hypothetical protein [Prevotellaceae bacterium]
MATTNHPIFRALYLYPFGSQMPGRTFEKESYRYSFQGQEKTPELNPSHTTAEYWEYDGRLSRRWNIDPKFVEIPQWSPYVALGDNPIINVDKKGDLWDAIADAAFILYDVGEIGYDYFTKGKVDPVSVAALSADVGMLFVPIGTGGGLAVRGAAKTTEKVVQAAQVADKVSDIRKITKANWGKVNTYGSKKQTAIEHIKEGHFFDSRKGQASSRFSESNSTIAKVKELTNEAVAKGKHRGTEGNYTVTHTFDDVIGTTSDGKKTNTIRVYLDDVGNVLNSYPIPTPKK